MQTHVVQSFDDPLLWPYRNMKDKELAREGRRFIAEGEQVVRRLLASTLEVESVLLSMRKVPAIVPLVRESVPVFLASDEIIEQVIGFEFHSGVLACGIRPASGSLKQVVPDGNLQSTLAVCQAIANTENMGALIRIAAAFGCDAMILGESCCDPYFRQSVRVSMGTIFRLPLMQSNNLLRDLHELRERWNYDCLATVLDDDAEPLAKVHRSHRTAVIFGNEAQGLDLATIAACNKKITIPMRMGTDSLNVSVAAGVTLYHLTLICD